MKKISKKISLVLVFGIVFSMIIPIMPDTVEASKDTKKITILGTSDTHSDLYGFTYEDDVETDNSGMARLYSYIEQTRKENSNTILVDNGDTYQGTILADAVYNKNDKVVHPVSKVINHMKYDAVTLGNHEFNFGMDFVNKIIDELDMPVLGANVSYKNGKELTKPYKIIEKDGVKIGIIGLTNPNAPRWDGDRVEDLEFGSITEYGKKYAEILKNKEKVDLIFVTAHAGLEPEYDIDNGSDGVKDLINEVDYIDGVLLGHFHTNTAEEINNTIVGSPRNNGRSIVRFDFELKESDKGYKIIDKSVKTVDMEGIEPSQEIRDLIKDEHKTTIDFIKGEGSTEDGQSGGGIFGYAEADFQPENEIKGIPEGKLRDTAVIDLIGKVQLDMSGSDVTAVALFQDKSNIKKGDINYGSLFNIYKFDNTLFNVEVTGKELVDYMEWSAEHYNTWKPGDINISFNEEVPGYRYDMFKGVDYKIDLSKPAGERIKDVIYKGKPLKDDEKLILSVNNYRYSSGLKANDLVKADRNWESPEAIREKIAEYIQEKENIKPEVENNWEIVGVDLSHPLRDDIIKLINNGQIDTPYNKSLNIKDLEKQGIIKDNKLTLKLEEKEEENIVEEEKTELEEDKKIIYTVKSGDTLYRIGVNHKVNYRDIAKHNKIKNASRIYPGQKLEIIIK